MNKIDKVRCIIIMVLLNFSEQSKNKYSIQIMIKRIIKNLSIPKVNCFNRKYMLTIVY